MIWRTSSATKKKKLTTCSGWPLKRLRSSGSCVATPTGQVLRWQARIMMQPIAISGAVEKPISSAPSSAAITTSRPVFSWPSVWTDARAQVVDHERLLRLGEAELPRDAGRLDRGQRRRAGAAVVAGDQHVVGVRLRDARGDRADADLGHELHADPRASGSRSSGRRSAARDPRSSRCRGAAAARSGRRRASCSGSRNVAVDLVARQLAAFARLGALGHLDLELVGVDEVVTLTPKRPEAICLIAERRESPFAAAEARRVLPALARVRAPAEAVHRDRERLVASRDKEPSDIAPVEKRLTISFAGSTSSSGSHSVLGQLLEASSPRSVALRAASSFVSRDTPRTSRAAVADRVLEQRDRLRAPHVVPAVAAPRVDAADRQQVLVGAAGVGPRMAVERLAREHVDADARDPRRRAGEVLARSAPGRARRPRRSARPV